MQLCHVQVGAGFLVHGIAKRRVKLVFGRQTTIKKFTPVVAMGGRYVVSGVGTQGDAFEQCIKFYQLLMCTLVFLVLGVQIL